MKLLRGGDLLRRWAFFYVPIVLAGMWVVTNPRYSVREDLIDLRMAEDAIAEANALAAYGDAAGPAELKAFLERAVAEQGGSQFDEVRYYRLVDPEGNPVVSNVPNWGTVAPRRLTDDVVLYDDLWQGGDGSIWRLRSFFEGDPNPDLDLVAVERKLSAGWTLLVGRDTEFLNDLHGFYRASAWALVLVAVIGLGSGAWSTRSLLKSLNRINGIAREIIKTRDLSRRISGQDLGEVFRVTVDNLNTMLDKIEDLVDGVKQASNNIAHDLRTPLTRLRNRLETLSAKEGLASRQELGELTSEVDSLLGTFRSILHISQLEMGKESLRMTPVQLHRVVTDAVEMYEPIASERSQQIGVEIEEVKILGEENLLMQLISNVLDNACKYVQEAGRIEVRLWREGEQVHLTIRDNGAGIPEAERTKVFERFYRVDESGSLPGNGLGLSMAAAIAKAHAAQIRLEDANPGLLVRVVFERLS